MTDDRRGTVFGGAASSHAPPVRQASPEGPIVKRIRRVAVIGAIALRWGTVAQLAAAAAGGAWSRAESPALSSGSMAAYATGSVVLTSSILRSGRPDVRRNGAGDLALMCALLAAQRYYAAPEAGVSSWDAWGYGASVPTAVAWGMAAGSYRNVLGGMSLLIGSYAFGIAHNAIGANEWGTVVANSGGVLVGSLAAHLVWTQAQSIAARADQADAFKDEVDRLRLRLAEQARTAARVRDGREQRIRDHLHQLSGDLVRHAQALGQGSDDPTERAQLVLRTAARKAESHLGARGAAQTLGRALQDGLAGTAVYGSWNLTEEAQELRLPAEVLERVTVAARSFATNTERYSGELTVTVLGEVEDDRWTVSLIDSGRGFDMTTTPLNVGLREDLGNSLRRVGIDVTVTSAPGAGVSADLSGPVPREPHQLRQEQDGPP